MPRPDQQPDTTAITAGREPSGALSAPLWANTVWETDSMADATKRATGLRAGSFYSRYANPTVTQFEQAIASLEGAESALAFGSGMGALASTILAFCSSGSHVVAQNNLYGATRSFLEGPCSRWGITTTFVDPSTPGSFAAAVQPGKTMLVIAETPSNPRLAIADLAEIGRISGPFKIVDSTMATPIGQSPLSYGVDLVLHSATKGIAGHNDALLGVVAGERDLIDAIWGYAVMHGASASPHDALNALRGIRTLSVRTERQHSSALSLARALEQHPKVANVQHPFLASHPQHELAKSQMRMGGTLMSVELKGGRDECVRFTDALKLVRIATSFGGPETLVCHPASTTHVGLPVEILAEVGVTDGLLRFSVGLENVADLESDIMSALDAV